MLPRRMKALYYVLMAVPMSVSGWLNKHVRFRRTDPQFVHLGPGRRNYLNGWLNVDANLFTAKIDVWANLRDGIPFPDATVDAIYSHHLVEHLPDRLLPWHFCEMYRCLKVGGVIRVGGPHVHNAMIKYLDGDTQWFTGYAHMPKSIGGQFTRFVFCRGEHLTALTPSYLQELCEDAGFQDIHFCHPGSETNWPAVFSEKVLSTELVKDPEMPHTVIVEARKCSCPNNLSGGHRRS